MFRRVVAFAVVCLAPAGAIFAQDVFVPRQTRADEPKNVVAVATEIRKEQPIVPQPSRVEPITADSLIYIVSDSAKKQPPPPVDAKPAPVEQKIADAGNQPNAQPVTEQPTTPPSKPDAVKQKPSAPQEAKPETVKPPPARLESPAMMAKADQQKPSTPQEAKPETPELPPGKLESPAMMAKAKPQTPAPPKAEPRAPEPTSVAAAKTKPEVPPPAAAVAVVRPPSQPSKVKEVGLQPINFGQTASIKLANGFDFPVGKPSAEGYYKARGFRPNGHLGDDWNGLNGGDTDLGDSVHSIADGVVVFARDIHMGWGNVVIVRHAFRENGVVKQVDALYGHLQKMLVKHGQTVARGQKIATIGNAHGLYDAHLHFEIRKNIEIGISRAAFKRDSSNYYDPTQFIGTHRTLQSGGSKYRVALNTFAKDRAINFEKKRNYTLYRGGTSQSAAELKKAVAAAGREKSG